MDSQGILKTGAVEILFATGNVQMKLPEAGIHPGRGTAGTYNLRVCDVAIIICLDSLFLVFSATDCHSAKDHI